jgi:hypothetical protein
MVAGVQRWIEHAGPGVKPMGTPSRQGNGMNTATGFCYDH